MLILVKVIPQTTSQNSTQRLHNLSAAFQISHTSPPTLAFTLQHGLAPHFIHVFLTRCLMPKCAGFWYSLLTTGISNYVAYKGGQARMSYVF